MTRGKFPPRWDKFVSVFLLWSSPRKGGETRRNETRQNVEVRDRIWQSSREKNSWKQRGKTVTFQLPSSPGFLRILLCQSVSLSLSTLSHELSGDRNGRNLRLKFLLQTRKSLLGWGGGRHTHEEQREGQRKLMNAQLVGKFLLIFSFLAVRVCPYSWNFVLGFVSLGKEENSVSLWGNRSLSVFSGFDKWISHSPTPLCETLFSLHLLPSRFPIYFDRLSLISAKEIFNPFPNWAWSSEWVRSPGKTVCVVRSSTVQYVEGRKRKIESGKVCCGWEEQGTRYVSEIFSSTATSDENQIRPSSPPMFFFPQSVLHYLFYRIMQSSANNTPPCETGPLRSLQREHRHSQARKHSFQWQRTCEMLPHSSQPIAQVWLPSSSTRIQRKEISFPIPLCLSSPRLPIFCFPPSLMKLLVHRYQYYTILEVYLDKGGKNFFVVVLCVCPVPRCCKLCGLCLKLLFVAAKKGSFWKPGLGDNTGQQQQQ